MKTCICLHGSVRTETSPSDDGTCQTGRNKNQYGTDLFRMLSDCFTQNTNTCNHTCDYSEATLIFLPPNGSFSPASSLSQYGSGYLAAIHPELMCRAASGLKRQHPSFFDYHTNEALHLSLRESDQIPYPVQPDGSRTAPPR